ncbi:MAG: histidine kinase, partial [Coleofasciculaceae cyanobacterium]
MNSFYKSSQWLKNLFHWQLLPIITLNAYCEPEKMITTQEINLAVIKISGRQMMLCQRSALTALRLVTTANKLEQNKLIEELLAAIDLMERSHSDLINNNVKTQPSQAVLAIYFNAPLYLDCQIQEYIAQVRALAWQAKSASNLTLENPHLQAILKSETGLNEALEVLVNQYQKESEAVVQYLEKQQVEINYKSCASAAAAYVYAQQREQSLQDLRGMQAQLIQMEKLASIGQMLAGIAHEINNPVSFIYGNLCYASDYIQKLLELVNIYQKYYQEPIPIVQAKIKEIDLDFLQQDLPKVLNSMEVGAGRVRQIVISLRNFSRQDQIFLQSVDLHEGIDNTLLILQNSLKVRCHRPAIKVIKEYGDLPTLECCP